MVGKHPQKTEVVHFTVMMDSGEKEGTRVIHPSSVKVEDYGGGWWQFAHIIYESAMGSGLNLLMTVEILQKEYGIKGLTVYGSDYIAESVGRAKRFFREVKLKVWQREWPTTGGAVYTGDLS